MESEEHKGIIPRIMDYIFECILQADESLEFTVRSSFLEIYNEKLQDLLDGLTKLIQFASVICRSKKTRIEESSFQTELRYVWH